MGWREPWHDSEHEIISSRIQGMAAKSMGRARQGKGGVMGDTMQCECCDSKLVFAWTDTHGVGVCTTCGLPYMILHYEGEGKDSRRVEKPPVPALTDEGVALAREYWGEHKKLVFPAFYDMGISRNGRSYSGATEEDVSAFSEWYSARSERSSPTGSPQVDRDQT